MYKRQLNYDQIKNEIDRAERAIERLSANPFVRARDEFRRDYVGGTEEDVNAFTEHSPAQIARAQEIEERRELERKNLKTLRAVHEGIENTVRGVVEDQSKLEDIYSAAIKPLREKTQQLELQRLYLKQSIFEEKNNESLRLKRYKETRDLLKDRLKDEGDILKRIKLQANVKKAEIAQEKTLLKFRTQRLQARRDTGELSSNILVATGDTVRAGQRSLQNRQLTSTGSELERVVQKTQQAQANVAQFEQGMEKAQQEAAGFSETLGDANDNIDGFNLSLIHI